MIWSQTVHATTGETCEVTACDQPEFERITVPGRFVSLCAPHILDYSRASREGTRAVWMDANLPDRHQD